MQALHVLCLIVGAGLRLLLADSHAAHFHHLPAFFVFNLLTSRPRQHLLLRLRLGHEMLVLSHPAILLLLLGGLVELNPPAFLAAYSIVRGSTIWLPSIWLS